jgi:UDP-N-acetylmuramoylalanine--D-glutamate ligase
MSTIEQLASQGNVHANRNALLFRNQLLQVRNQHIRDIMSDYRHVACRMEYVATVCGIDFINDAKADNLNAAWYSLESMEKPVIWIVNNVDAEEGFDKIVPLLRKKVKAVILLGQTGSLPSVFSNYVERVYKANQIEDAVEWAYAIGIQGDAVLFSPAGGEYSALEDYKQQGYMFSSIVKKL